MAFYDHFVKDEMDEKSVRIEDSNSHHLNGMAGVLVPQTVANSVMHSMPLSQLRPMNTQLQHQNTNPTPDGMMPVMRLDVDASIDPVPRGRSNTWPATQPTDYVEPEEQAEGESTGTDPSTTTTNSVVTDLTGGPKKNTSRRNPWGNLSYADLIAKSIMASPDKRATLSQVYDWMVQNVPYFRDKGDSNSSAGWKNSIRHNLSLHSRFVRVQNEGTGKSSWWMLNPDAKPGKSTRRRANTLEGNKYEKKRGRAKKKVDDLRPSLLLPSASPSYLSLSSSSTPLHIPHSLLSPDSDLYPDSPHPPLPPMGTPTSSLPPLPRPRASSNASSCGRLSPIPSHEFESPGDYQPHASSVPAWNHSAAGYWGQHLGANQVHLQGANHHTHHHMQAHHMNHQLHHNSNSLMHHHHHHDRYQDPLVDKVGNNLSSNLSLGGEIGGGAGWGSPRPGNNAGSDVHVNIPQEGSGHQVTMANLHLHQHHHHHNHQVQINGVVQHNIQQHPTQQGHQGIFGSTYGHEDQMYSHIHTLQSHWSNQTGGNQGNQPLGNSNHHHGQHMFPAQAQLRGITQQTSLGQENRTASVQESMSPSHSTHSMSPNLNNNQHTHRATPDVDSHSAIFPTPPNSSLASQHTSSPSSSSSSNNNPTTVGLSINQVNNNNSSNEFSNTLQGVHHHQQGTTLNDNQGTPEANSVIDSSATNMLRSALTIGLDGGDHCRTENEQHLVSPLGYKEEESNKVERNMSNFDINEINFNGMDAMMPEEPIQKIMEQYDCADAVQQDNNNWFNHHHQQMMNHQQRHDYSPMAIEANMSPNYVSSLLHHPITTSNQVWHGVGAASTSNTAALLPQAGGHH